MVGGFSKPTINPADFSRKTTLKRHKILGEIT